MRKWLLSILSPNPIDEVINPNLNSDDLRKWLCMAEAVILIKLLESKINMVRGNILDNCKNYEEVKECMGRITAYNAIISYVKSARKPKEEKPNAK